MNRFIMASIIGAVLIAAIAFSPLMTAQIQTASASGGNCEFTGPGQKCDFDIKKLTGGFKLSLENNIQAGGSGGTVDQEARNDIVNLQGNLSVVQAENAGMAITIQNQGNALNATNSVLTSTNTALSIAQGQLANLTRDFEELKGQVIIDINLTNGTVTPIPEPEEPVDNQTGNTTTPTDNQTGPIEPGGNTTVPTDNQTGPIDGNVTVPTDGNTTNTDGNVTIPVEGNVTLPTDGNVTVPLENGTVEVDPGIGDNASEPFNPASVISHLFNQWSS